MDLQDIIMEAVIKALSEKIDEKQLRYAFTKEIHKKIYKNITYDVFYKLLKENKLNLSPGFGTVLVKEVREKEKKVFNKKTGSMENKKVGGRKVAYRPGDLIKQLL